MEGEGRYDRVFASLHRVTTMSPYSHPTGILKSPPLDSVGVRIMVDSDTADPIKGRRGHC